MSLRWLNQPDERVTISTIENICFVKFFVKHGLCEPGIMRVGTHFLSTCRNVMSMAWIEVKTLVAPWTTHSRVSGMATGVQVARNTGSFREQSGTKDK